MALLASPSITSPILVDKLKGNGSLSNDQVSNQCSDKLKNKSSSALAEVSNILNINMEVNENEKYSELSMQSRNEDKENPSNVGVKINEKVNNVKSNGIDVNKVITDKLQTSNDHDLENKKIINHSKDVISQDLSASDVKLGSNDNHKCNSNDVSQCIEELLGQVVDNYQVNGNISVGNMPQNKLSNMEQLQHVGNKNEITPLRVKRILENVPVKNSPDVPSVITDKMVEEENKYKLEEEKKLEQLKLQALDELTRTGKQERYNRLQNLLDRSQTYSTYLLGRINARQGLEQKKAEREEKKKKKEEEKLKEEEEKQKQGETHQADRKFRDRDIKSPNSKTSNEDDKKIHRRQKRKSIEVEGENEKARKKQKGDKSTNNHTTPQDSLNTKSIKVEQNGIDNSPTKVSPLDESIRMINGEVVPDQQPKLLTGGVMRKYQIEGMEWLRGLFENGINGILADEMGLGKTLQSIALIASLIEQRVLGPFMIAAPLSTLPNWVNEFKRFTPQIYTILYHGSKDERAELRRKMMRLKRYNHGLCSLPVVISSYEILMRDRALLNVFNIEWKYLIVDEGHRLKNMNCRLIRELKLYNTANRLLLTGTPLQNNLAELWSLLNFLLPDIFDDLSSFQQWFDFSTLSNSDFIADEQEASVLQTLHSILTPFLLRRLKTDVDLSIPPKKEVLVYAPLTAVQQNYYKTTLDRTIFDMIHKKNHVAKPQELTPTGRPLRKSTKNVKYMEYEDDDLEMFDLDDLFKQVEEDEKRKEEEKEKAIRAKKDGRKSIINIRLQNVMMQLRKCCNHPYLLEFPFDSKTEELIIDERLVECSGKLLMLDRMLVGLRKRGHKVLIFSQMTMMMDILVDFCNMRNLKYSRLDGTMKIKDRQDNIERFDKDPDNFIFLLSTRSGGLGLNLMMADTCIIYDSDWNPQVDLQAQDRCHRIGQTKPVVVYRLVTANSIDQKIIERAACKRKLEKMVIHERRFKGRAIVNALTPSELIALLDSSDISSTVDTENIISDEQLNLLLDRSDLLSKMNPKHEPTINGHGTPAASVRRRKDKVDVKTEVEKNSSKLFTVIAEAEETEQIIF